MVTAQPMMCMVLEFCEIQGNRDLTLQEIAEGVCGSMRHGCATYTKEYQAAAYAVRRLVESGQLERVKRGKYRRAKPKNRRKSQ